MNAKSDLSLEQSKPLHAGAAYLLILDSQHDKKFHGWATASSEESVMKLISSILGSKVHSPAKPLGKTY